MQKGSFSAYFELDFVIVSSQLSMGPTDWWIGLSIGQLGEEVRCVCYGAFETFSGAATDSVGALNNVCLQVERQDGGRVSELGRSEFLWSEERPDVCHHVLIIR